MENYQDILFPYAYNILGSVEEAKDTIQDILLKYFSIDKRHIDNEIGYLTKSVINQSINVKKKKKPISNDSVWLPEPIGSDWADQNIDKEEILSYSLLVLLEKLSAKERAVFILKEAFHYSHKDIGATIGLTIENSRKTLSRAKSKLADFNGGLSTIYQENPSHLKTYIQVVKNGDVRALEKLLCEDISLAADGGDHVNVVRALTTGASDTANLILHVYQSFLSQLDLRFSSINHQPAILYFKDNTLYSCQVFEIEANKIKRIFSVVDPKKLKSLSL